MRRTKKNAYNAATTSMNNPLQAETYDLFVPPTPWQAPRYVWSPEPPVGPGLVFDAHARQLTDHIYSIMEEHLPVHTVRSQVSARTNDRPADIEVGMLVVCNAFVDGTKTDVRPWFVGKVLEVHTGIGSEPPSFSVWEYGNAKPYAYSSITTHVPKWQQDSGSYKKTYATGATQTYKKSVHLVASSFVFDWDTPDKLLCKQNKLRKAILNNLDTDTRVEWTLSS